ncbi:tetratricopeptide repeat protein [Haloferula sp.]|uniref:tetratricopeptide repeat protein n=1 Tax=Haloferula sp. TaxID=2497595 RepID=UPI00329ED169
MNPFRRILSPLLGAFLAAAFIAGPVQAQLEDTPQSLNAQATNEMKAGKWAEAHKLLAKCTSRFDSVALQLYGPQFGVTWYRKGYCELKLKMWDDAMKSFETCYKKYTNKSKEGGGNLYNKKALLYWGQAAQGSEDWALAIRMYKKFLEERDKTNQADSYPRGAFYIWMSICNFKLENIPEGVEHFETALKNKVQFATPEAGIVAAFQALVDSVIEKRDEKALLEFIDQNRADIVIEPYDMQPYSPLFLSLAGKAYNADMERSAFALYQLIPSTQVMLQDAESRLLRLGGRVGIKDGVRVVRGQNLKDSIAALEKSDRSGDPHEVVQLSATAFLHEKHGNVRGAFAAYEQLEIVYPKSKNREKYLYNLTRTSSVIGEIYSTEEYGSRFLKTFPNSDHVPAVRRMMLTSLFYGGQYVKCIQIAKPMLAKLAGSAPSKEHDICLHVLGGSYYYTGDYKKAQPLLDQHVEKYPKSSFELAALYFQASNYSRLQFWTKSAKLLDAFLSKHGDPDKNVYLPFALYDRANCHYALDETDAALEKLNRIESEFKDADIMDMALNLKGNVLQNQGKKAEAEEYYIMALKLAERRENDIVAGEALYYLISMLGDKPKKKDQPNRMAEAVPYSDKFWEEYGDSSPYKAQVAVAQVHALGAAGRGEEALNRLRDVIAEMATRPGAVGLEEAIGSYTEVYLDSHTPEELKNHYYNFPKIKPANKAARALLRIAVIGVFEDQIKAAGEDEQKMIKAQAGIKVLFNDLKNEFDVKDLSNFILVRVGDFIRETNSPGQAVPYYDEVLSREDKSYSFPALFGRAAVLAKGSKADQAKAVEDFKRVLADAQDKPDKDRALYQMIITQMAMGDHGAAKENAKLYLDREKGYTSRKMEVAMLLAQAYDEMGMVNDALAAYVGVWNTYKGALRISCPALKRYMELLWERNQTGGKVSDRQGAYNAGRSFIDLTRGILEKATQEEVDMWKEIEALSLDYVADPNVKSKEELAEEAASR